MEKTLYLINPLEETIVKLTSDGKAFAKFKGGKEFSPSLDSNMVNDALIANKETTEEEYNSY